VRSISMGQPFVGSVSKNGEEEEEGRAACVTS
jgi:hypothetical protein